MESIIKSFLIKPSSPYKLRILLSLFSKEPKSISDLQRVLGISYKETYRHIKEMILSGEIQKNIKTKTKHSPADITLTEKGKKKAEILSSEVTTNKKESIEEILKKLKDKNEIKQNN